MIKTENLSVLYDHTVQALQNVSMTLNAPCTVIVGQNGSGKSTFMQSILGIVKHEGLIEVNGSSDVNVIRQKVGMVFQNPDHQLFMNTIYEDLEFGLINMKMPEDQRKERIQKVAEKLDITHLLSRSSHKLSGGQKRMAAIATILVMEPEVIMMDEPTSFLDPKSRRQIIHLINELDAQLVITTHDLDMALDIADEVVIIKDGQAIYQGNIDCLKNKELMEDNGLELPFRYQ